MNERIKQLAHQAGWSGFEALDERNVKFAELIIRECANELLKWRQEPFPLDADSAARIIKQHFGIK